MKLPGLPDGPPATFPAEPERPHVLEGEVVACAPSGSRVTPAEVATIATLATRGLSVVEIAEAIGRHPTTVRANLRHARDLLKAVAPEAVELWVEAMRVASTKGNHHPMRDLLYAAGAAQHATIAPGPQMQVNIGIALPGLPKPPDARTDDGPDND